MTLVSKNSYIFTSESVSEGHPDKVADQISDAVLDAYLSRDPAARVAAETLVTTNHVTLAGEVSAESPIENDELESIIRKTTADIGYTHEDIGFDSKNANVQILLHAQSSDIAQGVTGEGMYKEEGAGDQGMMFGYAVNETEEKMPMAIYYAHQILKSLSEKRKSGEMAFLRPDAKAQVSIRYEDGKPQEVETIVVSTQHTPDVDHDKIKEAVIDGVVPKIFPEELIKNVRYYINPTGRFVIGGPHGDAGLTGRKIIVDTYGGYARHGGGAFSGKDPSKVDRSAAYMMRYVAKNIVASGIAEQCEIQVAYAIGVADPVSIVVNTFGTGKVSDRELEDIVRKEFDLTPRGIRETLGLRTIRYLPTASYGHFGRRGDSFPWENTDKASVFK